MTPQKIRRVCAYIVLALAIITLFTASLTLGRYSGEINSTGTYPGDMEFIVSDQIEVFSEEQFFSAIENGYSNIKIATEVESPIVITGSMGNVHSDLTIDLNGHELQRNNREPLLNVQAGVNLTIIDSSEKQTGCFYNPVGSVITVSGGTLTTQSGIFESGPRSDNSGYFGYNDNSHQKNEKNEYAELNGSTWSTPAGAKIEKDAEVTLFDASTGTPQQDPADMPVIIPNVFAVTGNDGEKAYDAVNGNMYFDGNSYNEKIPADTYVYFTIDDSAAENTTIAATGSANYYYEYWLRRKDKDEGNTFMYEYVSPVEYDTDGSVMPLSGEDAENVHKAKIYIYQNVKYNAGKPDFGDFAAIKMESGNLYVRGGTYYSYFGIDNTYCVQATGGLLTVQDGDFYAYENSTCIECDYKTSDIDNRLDVTAGYFYSEGADTVRVLSGTMQVADGVFEKDATKAASLANDSAAINMQQGTLSLGLNGGSATFTLTGSSHDAVYSQGGTLNIAGATININKDVSGHSNANGIRAQGGMVTCSGSTSISIDGTFGSAIAISGSAALTLGKSGTDKATFTLNGSNLNGIYSEGGTITAYNAAITFNGSVSNNVYTVSGEYGKDNFGIHTKGGTVTLNGSTSINVSGTASAGIRAEQSAEENQINISGASFNCNVSQDDGSGTGGQLSSTAISTIGGNINFAVDNANISSNGLGITVGNGDIVFDPDNSSNVELTTPRGTAVYVYGGSIALNEHTVFTVTSTIAQNYTWATDQTDGSNSPNIYNGIYISGGSLYANGTLNVTHRGVKNDDSVSGNNAFLNQTVKSFAVRVENSTGVNIAGGKIINQIYNRQATGNYWDPYTEDGGGGGIYVGGGNVYLGATYSDGKYAESANADNIQVSTTGTIAGDKITFSQAGTWSYDLLGTGGHAVEVSGGSLTVYGGTYSAAQGNGILVRNTSNSVANVTIENGTFIGRNGGCGKYGANDKNVGPGVFYGLYVVGGNLNVVINNGTFGELDGESNSGASFYGTYGMRDRATVDIYQGTFYGHSADAISVFRYIDINIGKAVQSDGSEITIQTDNDDAAPLSAQDDLVEKYNNRGSNINIYYGTFIGGRYDSGGYYNPYLKNNIYDSINEYGRRNTTGNNPDNVKTVFSYPK